MADTDATWLGAVLAKHAQDNSVVAVLDVKKKSTDGAGDNYTSSIACRTLQVVLGSGRVTTKKIFIKNTLTDIPQDIAADMTRNFVVEGIVYNSILSKCEALIAENNVAYDKLWPDCIYSSPNKIILEDLKVSGFTMASRQIGLDPSHAEVVLVSLARFHSLSLVSVSNGTIFPKLLPPYFMADTMVGVSFFRNTLKAFADVIRDTWSSKWSRVEEKLRRLRDDIPQVLNELYKQPHKVSVVNHGDCWNANMMFRYNSRGAPTDLKFLDFQMCHYNTYGWDLIFYLYSSVHPKYIASNYNSFLEIYSKEFSDNLARLGYDPSRAPTTEDVKEELIRLRPYVLLISCTILPVTSNPGGLKIGLEDLISDSVKVQQFFEDKLFEETIQGLFTHFINHDEL